MTSYAIFGDSYVSRLEKFTKGNMNFEHKIKFYGVPGMSTRRKCQDMLDRLCFDKPRFVFINLGGNNIDSSCNPRDIAEDILRIVNDIKMCGAERVFVSSIIERGRFPQFTNMNKTTFNKIRKSVNERLKKALKQDYVDMGKRLRPRHYCSDLVHPGDKEGGMTIFRATIMRCFASTT